MCGLAGMSGVKSADTRLKLVIALGTGIDMRGGHAAGYVVLPSSHTGTGAKLSKRIGTWDKAALRFSYAAARGEVTMMHSRFATCGSRDNVEHAHPFNIKRAGKSVLYGAHNGVISGTWASSRKYNRDHTVDSREVFELLADGKLDDIRQLEGYGVLTWIQPDSGDIRMVRLSSQSDIVVAKLKTGGHVYASTWSILKKALEFAGVEEEYTLNVDAIGQVFHIRPDGVFLANETKLTVAEDSWKSRYTSDYSSLYSTYGGVTSRHRSKAYDLADADNDGYNYRDILGGSYASEYTEEDRAYDKAILDAEEADEWDRLGRWSSNGKLIAGPVQEKRSIADVVRTDPAFTRSRVADDGAPSTESVFTSRDASGKAVSSRVITPEMTYFHASDGVHWRKNTVTGQWHKETQQQALLREWDEVRRSIATTESDPDKQRAMRLEAFKILQRRATSPIDFGAKALSTEPITVKAELVNACGCDGNPDEDGHLTGCETLNEDSPPDTLPSSAITERHDAAAEE